MYPTPKRENMKPRKKSDEYSHPGHRVLARLVDAYGSGFDRYRFTRALAVQLHGMRITLATLATPEGEDAATAVAMVLTNWMELSRSNAQLLPNAWLNAIEVVGGRDLPTTYEPQTSHFTNKIKIR